MLILFALAGCAGMSTVRQPAGDFYNAAVALGTAEQRVLSDLNASIARSYQDRAEADYLSGEAFDVAAKPPAIPQASIDVRIRAVQAVQLYAQKILDLTDDQANKTVNADAAATAQSFGKLLPGSVPAADMGAVTAAFTGIANIALDQTRYSTVVDAARAAQPHLQTLERLIRNDDALIRAPLKAAAVVDRAARNQVLEHIRSDRRVTQYRLHTAFRDVTAYGDLADLSAEQGAVNNLADAIVRANALLASGDASTAMAIARDALSRANGIYDVFKTTTR